MFMPLYQANIFWQPKMCFPFLQLAYVSIYIQYYDIFTIMGFLFNIQKNE